MVRIIGFDISSSCIGYGVLLYDSKKYKLVDINYIKQPKKGHLVEKLFFIQNKINELLYKYDPDIIAIEDIIKFLPGKSSAQTITILASYNRVAMLTCYNFNKKIPLLCNVMAIRHKLKIDKILPEKEEIPLLLEKHIDFKFEWQKNQEGSILIENYDAADGLAVALFAAKRYQSIVDELHGGLDISRARNKKQLSKMKKQFKELNLEYEEMTGKSWT